MDYCTCRHVVCYVMCYIIYFDSSEHSQLLKMLSCMYSDVHGVLAVGTDKHLCLSFTAVVDPKHIFTHVANSESHRDFP